jgi:hypothetical protein
LKVEQDYHRVVAEVSRSLVPVSFVLVWLGLCELGLSVICLSVFGLVSLNLLLPSWAAWVGPAGARRGSRCRTSAGCSR